MNFNIALSSFVYILIFVFPGVLFRKFYYRGAFTKQFNQGNLFERFIITLFLSIICLMSSVGTVLIIREVFELRFLESISYDTLYSVFDTLKDNELPDKSTFISCYVDFIILLLLIYSLSIFLGLISHSIVTILKLDVISNVLRFNDKWHYHIKGKTYNMEGKKYLYTEVNVLTEDEEHKVMYSGYLNDYTVDESNILTSLFLIEAHRYNYNYLENKNINRQRDISGSMIWIPCKNVLNVNFTHITEEKVKTPLQIKVLNIFKIVSYIIALFTITILWLDDFIVDFENITSKLIFVILMLFFEIITYNLIVDLIKGKRIPYTFYLFILVSCLILIATSINLFNFLYLIGAEIILILGFNGYLYIRKNAKNKK